MTAPVLHRVVTEALFAHDWPDEDLAADCGAYSDDYRDAARAVLDALVEAGSVEFGVKGDGRVKKYGRDRRRAQLAARGRQATFVSRVVLPWEAAE